MKILIAVRKGSYKRENDDGFTILNGDLTDEGLEAVTDLGMALVGVIPVFRHTLEQVAILSSPDVASVATAECLRKNFESYEGGDIVHKYNCIDEPDHVVDGVFRFGVNSKDIGALIKSYSPNDIVIVVGRRGVAEWLTKKYVGETKLKLSDGQAVVMDVVAKEYVVV